LRPLKDNEKRALYNLTKAALLVVGLGMTAYGLWFFVSQYLKSPGNSDYWFGIFPAYLGSMMVLISFAMKLEWFTDARRFW
jgi:hypothetical protein